MTTALTFQVPDDKVILVTAAVQAIIGPDPTPLPGTPFPLPAGYPQEVVHNGMHYWLHAPLHPSWLSGSNDQVLSGLVSKGVRLLQDPSNADPYHNPRSPSGYPLIYGMNMDHTNFDSPNMPARVLFNGVSMLNEAEIADYKSRSNITAAAQAADTAATDGQMGVLQPGQTDIATLNAADLEFFTLFYQELQNSVGPRSLVKTYNEWVAYGSSAFAPGLPASADVDRVKLKSSNWDWSGYTGPLRQKLADVRGVASV